jgi:hypothetical protein
MMASVATSQNWGRKKNPFSPVSQLQFNGVCTKNDKKQLDIITY